MLLGSFTLSNAQGQLTGGVQTTSLSASISHWVFSTSDSNRSYYAIASWRGISGNYLKIYDASTFNATSPQVQISTYPDFTRVRIDNSNNVYVLYHDKVSGKNSYATFLKKYNVNGTLIAGPLMVSDNTQATDIEVAPNGDVLITRTNGNSLYLYMYRNMIFKGYKYIGSFSSISNTSPFAVQTDMKGYKLVIAYSYGNAYSNSRKLEIKRYNYIPTFSNFSYNLNLTSVGVNYLEYGSGINYRNNNNVVALRNNWEVFYAVELGTYTSPIHQLRKITIANLVSSFSNSNSSIMVDIDIHDKLLVSRNIGTSGSENNVLSLYTDNDTLIEVFTPDTTIKNHLTSLSIYDCEFVITGIDRKLGDNPNNHTYESFHQLFNCKDCRPNMGATAVASFRYPYQVVQVPSYYGDLDVTELCLEDDLLVNGSLSSCETGYFVELSEFDPLSWTDVNLLHSGWVYPLTQAPNNINIVEFLPSGYHLRPGKIYRFKLAVGNPWDSVTIFFKVSCCHREIVVIDNPPTKEKNSIVSSKEEKKDVKEIIDKIRISPNPAKDILYVNINKQKIVAYQVVDIKGEVISSKKLSGKDDLKSITINQLEKGVYLLVLLDKNGRKNSIKFIKE